MTQLDQPPQVVQDEAYFMRRRLESLVEKTKSAKGLNHPSFWAGDKAGKRQFLDDQRLGRTAWRAAHQMAQYALAFLGRGEIAQARKTAWAAHELYEAALEAQLKVRPRQGKRLNPSDEALARPAGRRGRPRKKP